MGTDVIVVLSGREGKGPGAGGGGGRKSHTARGLRLPFLRVTMPAGSLSTVRGFLLMEQSLFKLT